MGDFTVGVGVRGLLKLMDLMRYGYFRSDHHENIVIEPLVLVRMDAFRNG